jgi:type I restriction enzyme M protein
LSVLRHSLNLDEVSKLRIPRLPDKIQLEIVRKVQELFIYWQKSQRLLELAKLGVEKAIEEGEAVAIAWLEKQLETLNKNLKE